MFLFDYLMIYFLFERFENVLPEIFTHMNEIWKQIDGKMKSEAFRQKILSCVRAWQDWAIYPSEYLINLQNRFMGLATKLTQDKYKEDSSGDQSDVDGKPLEEEEEDEDEEKQQQKKILDNEEVSKAKFVSCKWETVDPEELEKQAVTSSKWDYFDEDQKNNNSLKSLVTYGEDDEDGDENKNIEKDDVDKNVDYNDDDDNDDDDLDGKPMEEDSSGEDLDGKPLDDNGDDEKEKEVDGRAWMDEMKVPEVEKRRILREIEVRFIK